MMPERAINEVAFEQLNAIGISFFTYPQTESLNLRIEVV